MKRKVCIYFGNAKNFNKKNFYMLEDYYVDSNGNVYDSENNILKTYMRSGYKYVELKINGILKKCKVHRIVACTFTDICGEMNEVVNHLDENKINNKASNLQWTTNEKNLQWGNIKQKRTDTVNFKKNIRNKISNICEENNVLTKGIKITKLKTCYKIRGKDFIFYTIGYTDEIDYKKSNLKIKQSKDIENKKDNTDKCINKVDSIIDLLCLFPEHINEFTEFIKRKEEIKKFL